MRLKLLIADDHRLMLEALRQAFEDVEDMTIVGQTDSGTQVLPLVERTCPDIVLVDLRMPAVDGLTCIDRIKARFPRIKTVVLSAFDDSEHVQAALRHGASAFISKRILPPDLPAAVRQVAQGTVHYAAATPSPQNPAAEIGLTEREITMLRALSRGLTNSLIGRELWVTEQTVKFHLTNIYRKLGVENRTEAVRYAYQHGLVDAAA